MHPANRKDRRVNARSSTPGFRPGYCSYHEPAPCPSRGRNRRPRRRLECIHQGRSGLWRIRDHNSHIESVLNNNTSRCDGSSDGTGLLARDGRQRPATPSKPHLSDSEQFTDHSAIRRYAICKRDGERLRRTCRRNNVSFYPANKRSDGFDSA